MAVFSCLSSVSAFDQSVTSGPSGTPISSTASALAVKGLPQLPGGGFDLAMPVTVGDTQSQMAAPAFTIHLTSAGGQCQAYPSGVYPVRLQLVDTVTGSVTSSITTHLVYTEAGPATEKLRFALVLPVQTTQGPAASPSAAQLLARPPSALVQPTPAAMAGLTGVVTALSDHPSVPVTIAASGQTVDLLDTSAAGKAALSQLTQLAADPSVHQFTTSPYAPVNATSLIDAGLGSELALQIARGSQILASGSLLPAAGLTANRSPAALGPWITNDGLDSTTFATLALDGYSQFVLPSNSITSSSASGSTAQPFTVGSSRSPVTAVMSEADLAARFTGNPGNPVLAAHQLIAELAQIYYERPNGTTPRGVVAVAPTSWQANSAFVEALLASLQDNPVVAPVTTAALFTALSSTATPCKGGCRLAAMGGGPAVPANAIRTQRERVNELATAAVGAKSPSVPLGDLVLAAESETLRPAQQSAVLANTGSAVDAQLAQFVVAGDRTVTLTSQQGTLQVTVVSGAPYPVTATLTLTSDKLLFPNGTTQWSQSNTTLLPNYTSVVPVKVRARTAGVFKVGITLHSPGGGLTLSNGEISVRSTATSLVGITLSFGAVAVLAVWWIRTSLKRRSKRAADGERDPADEPAMVR